ncbi:hypothetical protein ACFVZD_45645 [Streptomyces sp. NPDC058287]|uniref:hypothetical protein n=1 Tax=unclassified Streptomyces TaxID=2593676 RepID=UPI0036E886DD
MERTVGGFPAAQQLRRQPAQQRRQERSIAPGELHPVFVELALKHRDLMAQGEDTDVLVPVSLIGNRQTMANAWVTVR